MAQARTVLQVDHLTKKFGKFHALDDISFAVKAGEVYGFLGANGAGKSTTIRLVMDFIRPTTGDIRLFGKSSSAAGVAVRRQIGYLAGDVVLPKNTTGRKLLHYLAQLSGNVDPEYLGMLVQRFQAQIDKRAGTLSKGNRQKIGLIQAFMHQPKLVILDEPTSGLDPLMQEQFYKTVDEARKRGAAVFLSSHSFNEVEHVCDRIGIIRAGKLVYEGPIADITAAHTPQWSITLQKASEAGTLGKSSALEVVSRRGTRVVVRPTGAIEAALAALSKVSIVSMSPHQDELEDRFLSYYGQDKEAQT